MTNNQLDLVINNLCGFSDCLRICFGICSGKVFFQSQEAKNRTSFDITDIIIEVYKFLWKDTFDMKYDLRNSASILDSDTFERFLKSNGYQDKKIIINFSTNKVDKVPIEEDITEFVYTLFISIRNYIKNYLYNLTSDSLSKLILNQK